MFGSSEPSDVAASPPLDDVYTRDDVYARDACDVYVRDSCDAPPPSYADTVNHRGYCTASHADCHESLDSDYSDEVRFQ